MFDSSLPDGAVFVHLCVSRVPVCGLIINLGRRSRARVGVYVCM